MLELTPPTKIPWQVQILTLDYLVEGHLDSDRDGYPFRLFNHDITPIPLSQARFRPTGDLKLPERPVTPWVLINGDDLVAIIPRDDASVAHAIQVNASDRIASRADVFVGPYVIRGTVHSPHEDLRIFAMRVGFIVRDAEITCLRPDAQLVGLKAPIVLVLSRHKQLVAPID